jgi:hypothetical protein
LLVHSLFDLLALLAALAAYRLVPAAPPGTPPQPWRLHRLYIPAAAFGAVAGAYLFGSANLWLSGIAGVARSIEGALAGAIVAIELLKWRIGLRGSTGLSLDAPLAAAIAVGRIGCFLVGRDDLTYGASTALWIAFRRRRAAPGRIAARPADVSFDTAAGPSHLIPCQTVGWPRSAGACPGRVRKVRAPRRYGAG